MLLHTATSLRPARSALLATQHAATSQTGNSASRSAASSVAAVFAPPQVSRCSRLAPRWTDERTSRSTSRKLKDLPDGQRTDLYQTAFLLTAAAIPVSIALYTLSGQGTDKDPYFTRYIRDTYNSYATKWADRNDIHTRAIEQAGADRTLFLNTNIAGPKFVDHRYPEQLNSGSPWNVTAGQGSINLDKVIEKYQQEAREHDEIRRQQLKDNVVPIEQAYSPEWRNVVKKD